jgi:mediator of RNA polymerase II transcription subunit 21
VKFIFSGKKMTKDFDRLSQLQQTLNQQSEIFFTVVGALQRDAPLLETNPDIPVSCWSKEQIEANLTGNKELAKTAAKDIVQLSKVVDFLIEHLPGINQSEEEQVTPIGN